MSIPSSRDEAARPLRPLAEQQAVFAALFALLAIACWTALWWWSASPYARYLEHPGWIDFASFAAFCRSVAAPAGVHVLAWLLMIAAMMLPTTYPLLSMFRRITSHRADGSLLTALIIAGFIAVWLIFGAVAHVADAAVQAVASSSDWVIRHGWAIGATVLAGAGLFQFSALKYRCLEQCQAPFGFVASRWHGLRPKAEALRIGIDHGIFCVGCCWALMLVMFVVGTGSIGWMLALAAAMAAEKNFAWGRRLRAPIGLGLIASAGVLVAINS